MWRFLGLGSWGMGILVGWCGGSKPVDPEYQCEQLLHRREGLGCLA